MSTIRTTFHGRLAALRSGNRRLGAELAEAQRRASTGLRYSRPSDDVGQTSRLHMLREQADDQQVYADNAEWAQGLMGRADGALGSMARALSDARELAVQMSSETYSDADRQRAEATAQGLLDRAIEAGNAQFGGRYIFAGNAYDAPAYDATGAYQGDAGTPDIPVSDGVTVAGGFDGSTLLQGTTDIMASIADLVTAMNGGQATDVQAALGDLDLAMDQLSAARSIVGNEMLVADDALDLTVSLEIELSEQVSAMTEVDAASSYARLFEVQTAFEAALQVTASSRTGLLFSRI